MLRHRTTRVVIGALVLAVALGACRFQGFGNAPVQASADQGAAWLRSVQEADGGFELSNFPGFETPDAITAIASPAQTKGAWNTTEARTAMLATVNGGHSPLHAVDDYAASGLDAGQSAKLIVLVALPLGLSPFAFDPDGDGAQNLVATMNGGLQPDGSFGLFNATLYAAIARAGLGVAVPATTVAYIRAAQKANGGWNYLGTASGTDLDIDTTALAVQALVAARVDTTDPDLQQALAFLANNLKGDGAFQSFGTDDPNSTSTAVLAISAAGYNVQKPCWRNTFAPALSGQAYSDPLAWLRSQQTASGRIQSPNDGFGVNTFATSQTVQALERNWLPVLPLPPKSC